VGSVRCRPTRPAIQSHREQDGRQKRHGDDGAANGGAGSVKHDSDYSRCTSRRRPEPGNTHGNH
jgi:hypothetical protein